MGLDYRQYVEKYRAKTRRKATVCPACREPFNYRHEADINGNPLICESCYKLMKMGEQIAETYTEMELVHLCCQSYVSAKDLPYQLEKDKLEKYQDKINKLIAVMVGGGISVVIRAWDCNNFVSCKQSLLRKSSYNDHINSDTKAVITTQEAADAAKELVVLIEELVKVYGNMKYEYGRDFIQQIAKGTLTDDLW